MIRRVSPALLVLFVLSGIDSTALAAAQPAAPTRVPLAEGANDDSSGVRPDAVSAMLTPRASGKRVENLAARTESSQTFAEPTGVWTLESATGPERVRDATGVWHDLDLTLIKGKDGKLRPRYAAAEVVFSGGGDRVLATVREGKRSFSWRLPAGMGVLPAPVVTGGTAIFRSVRPNQDLVVQARPTGFVHFPVLKARPRGPVHLSLPLEAAGTSVKKAAGGGAVVTDGKGRPLVVGSAPLMWNATEVPGLEVTGTEPEAEPKTSHGSRTAPASPARKPSTTRMATP